MAMLRRLSQANWLQPNLTWIRYLSILSCALCSVSFSSREGVIGLAIAGSWLQHHSPGFFASVHQNLRQYAQSLYDDVLKKYDLIALPTVAVVPPRLPEQKDFRKLSAREFNAQCFPPRHTSQFNLTHHPAMSIPCGLLHPDEQPGPYRSPADSSRGQVQRPRAGAGLPVGLMLVGRHFDEATIYRAAYAFEQNTNWTELEHDLRSRL